MGMHTQIDWLSFTIPHDKLPDGAGEALYDEVQKMEWKWLPGTLRSRLESCDWTEGKRRAPYSHCAACEEAGLRIYFGGGLTHTLYEFSGVGCAWLRLRGLESDLLFEVASRVTRLDIASDIETALAPRDFVASGVAGRMKSRGSFTSETGDTEYIGSQKSERFARVYRYAPPHPRADLLRIEHVLRRDYAKQAASWIVAHGVSYVQKQIGQGFAWEHPIWQPDEADVEPLKVPRGERRMNGTLRWLIKSAAPAFRKLVAQGLIENPEEFLKEFFLNPLDGVQQLGLQFPPTDESFDEE